MWQVCYVSPSCFWHNAKKRRGLKAHKLRIEFLFRGGLKSLELILSLLLFFPLQTSLFSQYLCFVMTVKHRLLDWICPAKTFSDPDRAFESMTSLAGSESLRYTYSIMRSHFFFSAIDGVRRRRLVPCIVAVWLAQIVRYTVAMLWNAIRNERCSLSGFLLLLLYLPLQSSHPSLAPFELGCSCQREQI